MSNAKDDFALYLLEELGRTEGTIRQYRYGLDVAEKHLGKPIEEIDPDGADLRRLKRDLLALGRSPDTVKSVLVAVRQFRRWGVLEKRWERDNNDLVVTPRVFIQEASPLPVHQVRQLMAACRRPLEYRLVFYGLFVGTRIGESAIISGEHWNADGVLRFPGEKNRRWREVPIHPELEAVKWKILAHPPTYDSTLQRVKRRMEKRTGIDFIAHQLRKTFSTRLDERGVPDRVVKELLGHASDVTGRYIKVSLSRKREAVAALNYGNAPAKRHLTPKRVLPTWDPTTKSWVDPSPA